MKYIFIVNNKVQEIIPEYSNNFPNINITERYAPYFLEQCFVADDLMPVEANWDFFQLTKTFKEPIKMINSDRFEIEVNHEITIPISFNTDGKFTLESELIINIEDNNLILTPTTIGQFDIIIYFIANDERTSTQFIKIIVK